jgi:hypothetical protein
LSTISSLPPSFQSASFSCRIDGQVFSGKGNNSYSKIAIKSAADIINFILVPMDGKIKGVPPQINFFVAPAGTTTVKNNNGKYSVKYSPGGVDNDYQAAGVTVVITASTAGRIACTFSSKFTGSIANRRVALIMLNAKK